MKIIRMKLEGGAKFPKQYRYNESTCKVEATYDEGATWVTGATITSLAPQGVSGSVLIKNTIPPPTQMLGPRAPRFEVTIGSWS